MNEFEFKFKPFDKVLVRQNEFAPWRPAILYKRTPAGQFLCLNDRTFYGECIPYNEETKGYMDSNEPYEPKQWVPQRGVWYHTPYLNASCMFCSMAYRYCENEDHDVKRVRGGWVFRTKKECDAFCDKLNKAIENVK